MTKLTKTAITLMALGAAQTASAEEINALVWCDHADAALIEPGLTSINSTGRVVAGALPLLYGMGEGIVVGATFVHEDHEADGVNRPAMGTRRSRMIEAMGVDID